jgi:hypothetical protein
VVRSLQQATPPGWPGIGNRLLGGGTYIGGTAVGPVCCLTKYYCTVLSTRAPAIRRFDSGRSQRQNRPTRSTQPGTGAGFSIELTAHAFALIDSYVFGFALSDNALPIHGPESVAETAASMMEQFFDAEAYPYLLEFTMEHVMRPDYDFGKEFEYGLAVILDGLAASLLGQAPSQLPSVEQD